MSVLTHSPGLCQVRTVRHQLAELQHTAHGLCGLFTSQHTSNGVRGALLADLSWFPLFAKHLVGMLTP